MSVLHIIIIKRDESRSQSEEYLPNGSQYAYNNGLSTGRNSSFWENIYMTGSLSDRTEINFRHNINHSRLNSVSEIFRRLSVPILWTMFQSWRDDAMIPPEFRINKNTGNSQNKTNNLMIGNNLLITHKLNDIGRKLSIELRNDYSNQASGNYQQSSITYYQLKNDLGQIRFYIEINTGSHLPEIYYWRGRSAIRSQ